MRPSGSNWAKTWCRLDGGAIAKFAIDLVYLLCTAPMQNWKTRLHREKCVQVGAAYKPFSYVFVSSF